MSINVSNKINYSIDQTLVPNYYYTSEPPVKGSDTSIQANGTVNIEFNIPKDVINLAQSYISMDFSIGTVNFAATTSSLAMVKDAFPCINSISLVERGGQPLVQINDVGNYMKTILPRNIDEKSYLLRDESQYFYPSNEFVATPMIGVPRCVALPANAIGIMNGSGAQINANGNGALNVVAGTSAIVNNASAAAVASTSATVYTSVAPSAATVDEKGVVTEADLKTSKLSGNMTPTGRPASVNMLENKHIEIKACPALDGDGHRQAINITNRRLYLSDFKETLLAIDKDLRFPETLTLTLRMGDVSKYFTELVAAAGGIMPYDQVTTNLRAITDVVTLSNIRIYYATERNPLVVAQVERMIENKTGYEIVVPFVDGTPTPFQTSSSQQTVSCKVMNMGKNTKLKRIYHTVFNDTNVSFANIALDCSNSTDFAQAEKIKSYQTKYNSDVLQQHEVNCLNDEEWFLNNSLLKGTAILNKKHFMYYWAHVDDFTDGLTDDNTFSGKIIDPRSTNETWTFTGFRADNAPAVKHYTFIVYNRILNISLQGAVWT